MLIIIGWISFKKFLLWFLMNVKKVMNCINFVGVLYDVLVFYNVMYMIIGKWVFFFYLLSIVFIFEIELIV